MNWKNIFSNWIVRNLLLAVIVVLALAVGASIFLDVVTRHNKEILVPDFTGMSVEKARRLASSSELRIDVVDSIYVKRVAKGAVVRQEPRPGQNVKTGRRIMLTINAVTPKKVPMPNLVGYSLRSANAEIVSRGLILGRLVYIRDMATNNVMSQLYNNREIAAGTMIPSESCVDLVLGLNDEDCMTVAPVLYGLKYGFASEKIHDHSLNIGNVVYDKGIRTYADSSAAVVYRQNPEPHTSMTMGRNVTIYLTLDEAKVPQYNSPSGEPSAN